MLTMCLKAITFSIRLVQQHIWCRVLCTQSMNVCVSLCSPGVEFSLLQNLTAALLEDDSHYVIRFANSLFLQEGVTFNPEFLHLMKKYFRANVETVDFSESPAVAEQINKWVENHTDSKLKKHKCILIHIQLCFVNICLIFMMVWCSRITHKWPLCKSLNRNSVCSY